MLRKGESKRTLWLVRLTIYILKKKQLMSEVVAVFRESYSPRAKQRVIILITVCYFSCNIIDRYKKYAWQPSWLAQS